MTGLCYAGAAVALLLSFFAGIAISVSSGKPERKLELFHLMVNALGVCALFVLAARVAP